LFQGSRGFKSEESNKKETTGRKTLSKDNKPQQQVTTPKHSILKDKKANSKEDAISLVNETPISNHKVDKKYPPLDSSDFNELSRALFSSVFDRSSDLFIDFAFVC
jgi:hypothetical protein